MIDTHTPHSTNQPRRALLFACGNTFRGDDGVGWRIGCAAEQQLRRADLTVVMTRQLLPEHAQAISAADIVIFVDCSAVTAAGTVSTIPIQPAERLPHTLTHHLDPGSLLRLAHDLHARTPEHAVAITVGGESFEVTDRLSTTVKAAIPKALEAVRCALCAALVPETVSQTC
jgi:hydrogenase maturation protease